MSNVRDFQIVVYNKFRFALTENDRENYLFD